MVEPLPASLLISQGSCCSNGCQNCPYLDCQGNRHQKGTTRLAPRYQRWVLFDFDGTLADSLPLQLEAYQVMAQRHGWPTGSPQLIQQLRDSSLKEVIQTLGIPLWRVPFLLREGRAVLKNRWSEVEVFPGMKTSLEDLSQAGWNLGVVTANTSEIVKDILSRERCLHLFQIIESEPHLWKKASRLQNLIKKQGWNPKNVWYVGDEVRDLEAAHQVGIRPLGVGWGMNAPERLEQTGSPVVTNPQDLVHWITEHSNEVV